MKGDELVLTRVKTGDVAAVGHTLEREHFLHRKETWGRKSSVPVPCARGVPIGLLRCRQKPEACVIRWNPKSFFRVTQLLKTLCRSNKIAPEPLMAPLTWITSVHCTGVFSCGLEASPLCVQSSFLGCPLFPWSAFGEVGEPAFGFIDHIYFFVFPVISAFTFNSFLLY